MAPTSTSPHSDPHSTNLGSGLSPASPLKSAPSLWAEVQAPHWGPRLTASTSLLPAGAPLSHFLQAAAWRHRSRFGSSGCQASGSYGLSHMPASCLRCTPFPLPLSGLLTPSRRPSLSLQTTAVSGLSARCPCHGLLHFLPLPLPISSLLHPQNHNAWNIFSTKVLMKRPGAALGAAGWAGFPFSALCPGPSSGIRTVQYIIKVSVHQARTMDVTSTEELTVPLPPFYR